MNKKEILKFIKASIVMLKKNDRSCWHYYLDNDLGIFVGWTFLRRTLEDPKVIHAERNPIYVIGVGVKVRRSGDENDYDQLAYPWSHKDFCVANFFLPAPGMTNAEYLKEITALLDVYKETVEDHKKGVVKYDLHEFLRKE